MTTGKEYTKGIGTNLLASHDDGSNEAYRQQAEARKWPDARNKFLKMGRQGDLLGGQKAERSMSRLPVD